MEALLYSLLKSSLFRLSILLWFLESSLASNNPTHWEFQESSNWKCTLGDSQGFCNMTNRGLRALRGPIDDESFSIVVPLKSSLPRYPYCPSFLENPLVSNSYTNREFEDNSNYKYSSEDLQVWSINLNWSLQAHLDTQLMMVLLL